MDDTRIGGILLEASIIKQEDLERCLQIQALSTTPKQLGEILVEEGVLTRKVLQHLLAIQKRRRERAAEQPAAPIDRVTDLAAPTELLDHAMQLGASDVILGEERTPRVRVAGELRELSSVPMSSERLWEFVKTMAGAESLERILRDKDLVSCNRTASGVRFRMSLFRQLDGLSVVVRLLTAVPPTLRELGHMPVVDDLLKQTRGLIMVTGPTGSGKTTTIASMVARLGSTRQARILVLDDVAEIRVPSSEALISYREIGRHAKSHAAGLASALREDLDVIVVGRLEDRETIELALQAAETGHLVIASMHAADCVQALDQLLGVFPTSMQPQVRVTLSAVLRGVIAQRLLPEASGQRRVLATEVLVLTSLMLVLIREGKFNQIPLMMQLNKAQGCMTMDDCLSRLAAEGRISGDDAVTTALDTARILKTTMMKEVPA
jgi:twitching motility protein PilT